MEICCKHCSKGVQILTATELITFENKIALEFEAGHIKAPVHLSGGNEEELIRIFREVKESDWIFSTHRNHYHALLKGVPPDMVFAEIMKGNSINLQFPEYNFFTSAIVGGILPIALGVAMTGQKVWCFLGDMAAETGIFHECEKYAEAEKLPITFIVEDNGLSVCTPTNCVWQGTSWYKPITGHYRYKPTWPHQGSGKWVTF